ncbi:MAG TPA: hypothetical protein VHZ74_06990 [Bryobacteraceae bacterium]|jgi:hypothetical protein|nr:hypothetical protein [Bryobacteraceae bacterium]
MSAGTELPPEPHLPDWSSLERGRFLYLPVVAGRLEFAVEVRRRILAARPAVVAVELPETLEQAYLDAIQRLPQISVIFYTDPVTRSRPGLSDSSRGDEAPEQAVYVPVEPADPFVEAIRSAQEIGAQVVFADPDANERPHLPDSYPDSYSLQSIPLSRYVEAYRVYPQERTPEVERFADGIAWKLQGADPFARVLVVLSLNLLDPVLDAMEKPQPEPARRRRENLQLVNAHPECLGEITSEYPFLQERYEMFRVEMREPGIVDRPRVQLALFREAEHAWVLNTGERMHGWQRRMLARYSRNLALARLDLTASLFDLTIAARSIVDENYAWDVWETASRYSHQQTLSDLETVTISGEEVWLNTKRIRLRRRLPSTKRRLGNLGLKPRKKEKFPGEWASELNGASICSYPPEDMVIENFGRFLKKKGKSVISEERATVEPFTASLLDGIDLRETIRNWHEGKIFVKNVQKIHGEVGSVVVIFDQDAEGRYNYMTTWLGENQNESDMAFYSTYPFEHLIGPGIGRAEYGGFLMSLPARRMYDVWADPDYDFAETKAERLLLAGLDYSIQKYVVYVAAKPPRSVFRNIAARFGRTIVYVPIGQLSPVTMKKIRVVHVLDGYDKRDSAKEFIW